MESYQRSKPEPSKGRPSKIAGSLPVDPVNEAALPDADRDPAASNVAEPVANYDLIELFFFAYRDFVGDPDRLLVELEFGRAHHRVLHFVSRHPGLTVAELLDILRITKQSLGRVLKELVDKGYIESRPGNVDRRQRLLFPSARGRRLALDLTILQGSRFVRALKELPSNARNQAVQFLLAMIDPEERQKVAALAGINLPLPGDEGDL